MTVEFIDERGDRWIVRECDDPECTVIERCVVTDHGNELEPFAMHLPTASLGKLMLALRTFAGPDAPIGD